LECFKGIRYIFTHQVRKKKGAGSDLRCSFTVASEFIPKDSFTDTADIDLWLKVNDTFRQQGNTKDMIFK